MSEAGLADIRKMYVGRIGFTYSVSKGRSCLDWARRSLPHPSWNDVVLVLLCAEASHLRAYCRPVTGAEYRFEGGSVISEDLHRSSQTVSSAALGEDGIPDDMSRSDVWEIDAAVRLLRDRGPQALADLAGAWRNEDVADYALMVGPSREHVEELLQNLACFGRHIAF